MAKKSSVETNNRRRRLVKKFAGKRARLKAIASDQKLSMEERFAAQLKLAQLPRNSARNRIRNRCEVTGRPRGYYRKLEHVAPCAQRTGQPGPDPRHDQVELVTRRGFEENSMTVTDPIGDMLTRIRNAQERGKSKVTTPASRMRDRVLDVLQQEGFIRGYADGRLRQAVKLRDRNRAEIFRRRAGDPRDRPGVEAGPAGLCRRSTICRPSTTDSESPSCRRRRVCMSDADARAQNVGGEVICTVF